MEYWVSQVGNRVYSSVIKVSIAFWGEGVLKPVRSVLDAAKVFKGRAAQRESFGFLL